MHVEESIIQLLDMLWIMNTPSKILIFGWRLLLNRFPTRFSLANRGIISGNHNLVCLFGFVGEESISHFFADFMLVSQV